jgi:hypothetical protein
VGDTERVSRLPIGGRLCAARRVDLGAVRFLGRLRGKNSPWRGDLSKGWET